MLWTLIKKESLENINTLRFVLGFAACSFLLAFTTFILVQDYAAGLSAARAAQQESRKEIESWTVFSQVKPVVIRRPSGLSPFGSSDGEQWGSRFRISRAEIPVFAEDLETGRDLLGFYEGLDFPQVIELFVSLLALLFAFDAVSGEKERGSLRLVLSNGVKRSGIIAGKFLGALFALIPIVVCGFIASVLIYTVFSPTGLSGSDWPRLGAMLLVAMLYGAVFIAVGVLISTLTRRSATSLVIGLVCWVSWIVILPNAVSFAGRQLDFEQDRKALGERLKALLRENIVRESEAFRGVIGRDYFGKDDMFIGYRTAFRNGELLCRLVGANARTKILAALPTLLEVNEENARRRFALEDEFLKRRLTKSDIIRAVDRISPASAFKQAINAIAGTGTHGYLRFLEGARRYRRELTAYIRGKGGFSTPRWFTDDPPDPDYAGFVKEMETLGEGQRQERMREIRGAKELRDWYFGLIRSAAADSRRKLDLDDMPVFSIDETAGLSLLEAAQWDMPALLIYLGAALVLAVARFNAYDVR